MYPLASQMPFLLAQSLAKYKTSYRGVTVFIPLQVFVGLICDRIGRKVALVSTTALIVVGAILATAAHGAGGSVSGLFWFLTIARYVIPFGLPSFYKWASTFVEESLVLYVSFDPRKLTSFL